ncbi:sulfatase-like hydrolase/transferase [Flavobacterium aquidurense]|uniref:sulfatase-like hydrolase/transferase n=1 Tax=Flavobacterium aquidurense TaxID=362413 RepID=UPI00285E6BFC|nr:sulfatase-like hydrolase/transferase [Flavobacterium aquidurense]MDR7370110.1 arylsulfatase A-like enzyme [Flavobacterium aquidurense]
MNAKIQWLALSLFSFSTIFGQENQSKSTEKPNIILIIADDAGWNDFGYHGSLIKTPNIDFLAKNGVELNRFYVNPTCSPTRASLLTGMPSSRMGIVAPISDKDQTKLPDSIATLPKLLHQNNYQTALVGKWHLGLQLSSGPKAYGFDYSYGFLHGQIDQYSHLYKNGDKSWYRNGEFIEEKGHATDLITNEAIKWLSKIRDSKKNFFLEVAYSAPHFPLQEEQKWKDPYMNTIQNSSRRDFAAATAHLDNSIGILLEQLKKEKLDKNTVVIFMSDNGAMENWNSKNEYNGIHPSNDVLGDNTPLRDWKTSNYEGAIRVPCVFYWKDHLKKYKNENYISVIDLLPSILFLAGDKNLPKSIEGKNVWTTISENKPIENKEIYVRGHLQESLINKPWKIIRTRHEKDVPADYELYNIEKDPEEKNNVFLQNKAIAETMKTELENQFKRDAKKVNYDKKSKE